MLRWQLAGGKGELADFLPWGSKPRGKDPDDIAAYFKSLEGKTFGDS